MRIFVAIELEESIKKRIEDVYASFPKDMFDINFTSKENIHITLKFLGEVDPEKIAEIEYSIEKSIANISPFILSIESLCYFGRPNFIRVVWTGIKQGKDKVIQIMNSLEESLKEFRRNEHPPLPHITIGRVKSGRNLEDFARKIKELSDVKFGEMYVNNIFLKKSELTKRGPIYSDLNRFTLK